jgi:hypothetical protein
MCAETCTCYSQACDDRAVPDVGELRVTVDRSYSDVTSDPEWLHILLETLAPEVDHGRGMGAWFYDASNLADLRIMHPTVSGTFEVALEAVFASRRARSQISVRRSIASCR